MAGIANAAAPTMKLNNRIGFLAKELLNGGGHLSFDDLRRLAVREYPGGHNLPLKTVYRVAKALEDGKPVKTQEDLKGVHLPNGGGMKSWLKRQRRKQRQKRARKSRKLLKATNDVVPPKVDETVTAIQTIVLTPPPLSEVIKDSLSQLKNCMRVEGILSLHVELVGSEKDQLKVTGIKEPAPFIDTV